MLQGLATPLRILMLLVMFFASGVGHHAAMAASLVPEHHAFSTEHVASAAHHGHQQENCVDDHCGTTDQSCCVMGQCMLILGVSAAPEFPVAAASERPSAPCIVLVPTSAELPFRPPTA